MDGDTPEMRLAKALIARRVELGYAKRAAFAAAAGLSHDRTLSDLERAVGKNHSSSTLALVEKVYAWEPGSIDRVMAGLKPIRIPGSPGASSVEAVERPGSDALLSAVLVAVTEVLDSKYAPETKLAMIRDVIREHSSAQLPPAGR